MVIHDDTTIINTFLRWLEHHQSICGIQGGNGQIHFRTSHLKSNIDSGFSMIFPFLGFFSLKKPAIYRACSIWPLFHLAGSPPSSRCRHQEPAGFWTAAPNNVWRDNAWGTQRICPGGKANVNSNVGFNGI